MDARGGIMELVGLAKLNYARAAVMARDNEEDMEERVAAAIARAESLLKLADRLEAVAVELGARGVL